MPILTSGGKSYTGRQYSEEQKKKTVPTPTPYSLEQLSKDINSGSVTTQEQLNTKLYNQGYKSDVTGNIAPKAPQYAPTLGSSRATIASTVTGGGGSTRTAGVAGKSANSAGAYYGSAGQNNMSTSFDVAGNSLMGTLGGKNVITGGGGSRVDRTAGVTQDPLMQYLQNMQGLSQENIRRQMAKERQQQIDAIEMSAKQAVSAEQQAGAQDLARQRSMNLRAGLGGSDFGASAKAEVRNRTNQNIQGIEAQKQLQIGNAIDRIEQLAQSRFQIQQSAMQQGFQNMFQVQQYTQAQEQQMRAQTLDSLKELGKAGVDIQTVKEQDPQLYERMMQASGMSDVEMEAVLNNAKPAPERIDYQYKVAGNKLIAYGVDPVTGTLKSLEQEVDLPENYSITTMPDGTVLALPDNWNGDTSLIKTVGNYAKPVVAGGDGNGLTPYQTFQATQGLKKNTQTMVAASNELKRQVGIMNMAWKRLESGQAADLNGTSQAIITTFNKILDPTSVVRESEYDRTPSGQALMSQIEGKIASISQGGPGLTKASLKELVDLGNAFAQNAQASIDAKNNAAREEAQFFGLNPDFVVGPGSSNTQSGGTTVLLGPDGNQYEVPNDQVDAFLADGGKRL